LIDQLVQIKMFGLPDDYLETYRQQIQEVTTKQIQDVAVKYVRPEEAAIIIVGDGAEVLEQLQLYTNEIEIYNTSGKRKEKPAAIGGEGGDENPVLILGDWTLDIQTPFGQNIPATLKVLQKGDGLGGSVASEMGDAEIDSASLVGNSFSAILSFDKAGQSLTAQIVGEVDGEQMEGSISLQDSPQLPFTGTKTS
jgi:hypothetical protein